MVDGIVPDVQVNVQPVNVPGGVSCQVTSDLWVVVAKAVIVYYRSGAPKAGVARVMSKNNV